MDRIPAGATSPLSSRFVSDGISEVTFATGSGGRASVLVVHTHDRRPVTMGINPTDILLRTWERMDTYYEMIASATDINNDISEAALLTAKAKARAFAEVLADMMPPFFTDTDDIIREARRRYKAKQAGQDYETPGLGSASLAEFDQRPELKVVPSTPATPAKPAKPRPEFDEKRAGAIRLARDSGMFTLAQLAKTYDTTTDHIKEL